MTIIKVNNSISTPANRTIYFNIPYIPIKAEKYLKQVMSTGKLSGDHDFTKRCNEWIKNETRAHAAILTTSCTHALEMAALLIGIKSGDEVIMPSFTFSSTANSFILRGAKVILIDIRPDTMNMDENLIVNAISNKTRAIVPVHYAGVSCEMNAIMEIANAHKLHVIEDAAQGMMSTYCGKSLGTIGHIGAYSFHETKNYTCGEGGAILINDDQFIERAEIIREKGTNRSRFFRGEIDKYSWEDVGSSYLPSELNAAFLFAQLEIADRILENRLQSWALYAQGLEALNAGGYVELPTIPKSCTHNAHMFYIKAKDLRERTELIDYLKSYHINALFHYVPLHSSTAGMKYGKFIGNDIFTTRESERIVRLPLYYKMPTRDIECVCESINSFYRNK